MQGHRRLVQGHRRPRRRRAASLTGIWRRRRSCYPDGIGDAAKKLYDEILKLPESERRALARRVLADVPDAKQEVAPPTPPVGMEGRLELLGQVMDLALDPPRFTVRTARGPVVVRVTPDLLDAAREAWGRDALVGVDAILDADGIVHNAVAATIEPVPVVDDPLAVFEATFGMGAELFASPEGREYLETMRGAV